MNPLAGEKEGVPRREGRRGQQRWVVEKGGPYAENLEVDALIVGAGFAGIFMLKTLRQRGYKTVIFEAGNDTGGTWRWNCYPGAGVDSEVPEYEFSWPEVWKTWDWTSNYPNYQDLRAYFDHVDKVIGVKKDCAFNTVVVGANFDTSTGKWTVRTEDGRITRAKYLILGTGFAARRYIPDWPGMDKFKGVIHHSSFWPDQEIDVKNKRCAVIGTGASGVQIVQAWGPAAGEVKVFQRTPNLAIPMRRRQVDPSERGAPPGPLPRDVQASRDQLCRVHSRKPSSSSSGKKVGSGTGWPPIRTASLYPKPTTKRTTSGPRRRGTGSETRGSGISSRQKKGPHYFGIKRPCLEYNYYEQFNRPSVDVVDIKNNPIKEFTETGITLADGTHHEFDVIAVATGFDVVTGVMTQLGLESINKTKLEEEWSTGAQTYLGTSVSGYPNMFHIYGPHGPTLFSNGPSTVEVQGRWIADMVDKMQRRGIKYVNPKAEAAAAWKKHVVELNDRTLFPTTRSTYMGGNMPGKPYEPVCYVGGIPAYKTEIREALDSMQGFEVVAN
ncbi:cyclopentanone monooxygenase [Apiospora hydei]|uniref:Cyclopentanone monooxygenase n=1 Tax=Apiospora hydei TaxID=1337664 RepID=A0ABR1V925_9PEZI